MWRQIRDPDFLLGALKTYRMMTGLSPDGPGLRAGLVGERAAANSPPIAPFPTPRAELAPARRHRPHGGRRQLRRARRGAGRRGAEERLLDLAAAARLRRAAAPIRRWPRCRNGSRPISPDRTAPRFSPAARTRRCGSASTAPTPMTASTTSFSTASRMSPRRRRSTARSSPAAARRTPRPRSPRSSEDMLKLYYEDYHRAVGQLPARHARSRR